METLENPTVDIRGASIINALPPTLQRAVNGQRDLRASVVIASIYPKAMASEEPHRRMEITVDPNTGEQKAEVFGITQYNLPASAESMTEARDNVRYLRVFDSWQSNMDPVTKETREYPLDCRGIAESLIRKWTAGALGNQSGGYPGMMIVQDESLTDAQFEQLFRAQITLFSARAQQAEDSYRQNRIREIGEPHRMAAIWLNQQDDYEWVQRTNPQGRKLCMACRKSIENEQITCNHCSTRLVQEAMDGTWSMEYVRDHDPFVYEAVRNRRQREKETERKRNQRAKARGGSGEAVESNEEDEE